MKRPALSGPFGLGAVGLEIEAHSQTLHNFRGEIGLREGLAGDVPIQRGMPAESGIHTVTMYIGAQNQTAYYQYILSLNPKRVIFNPGSENPEFADDLRKNGISVVHACTLMMLDYGDF